MLRSSIGLKSELDIWKSEFHSDDPHEIVTLLGEIERAVGARRFILLDDTVGAIEAPGQALLDNASAIWEPEKQDLRIVSSSSEDGLLAEANLWPGPGPRHDRTYFELKAWGDLRSDTE